MEMSLLEYELFPCVLFNNPLYMKHLYEKHTLCNMFPDLMVKGEYLGLKMILRWGTRCLHLHNSIV